MAKRGPSRFSAVETLVSPREARTTPETDNAPAPTADRDLGHAAPRHRFRPSPKALRRSLIALACLVVALPTIAWVHYQVTHATSTNALVQGHVSELGTRLDGVVAEILVDAGSTVTKGQALLRFEDDHLSAEVAEARAEIDRLERAIEVEQLEIDYQRAQLAHREREGLASLQAAEARAQRAEIGADDARHRKELRETLLAQSGAISTEEVRDAEIDWQSAQARLVSAQAEYAALEAAEAGISLTREGLLIREKRIGVLETEVRRARARLARASADLNAATIRAPEDGAIVRRLVQPGASVKAGEPTLAMWIGQELWVDAWIGEDDLSSLAPGGAAEVSFDAFPDRAYPGTVESIGMATDFAVPDTQMPHPRFSRMRGAPVVNVRVRLSEAPTALRPGLSAAVAVARSDRVTGT